MLVDVVGNGYVVRVVVVVVVVVVVTVGTYGINVVLGPGGSPVVVVIGGGTVGAGCKVKLAV